MNLTVPFPSSSRKPSPTAPCLSLELPSSPWPMSDPSLSLGCGWGMETSVWEGWDWDRVITMRIRLLTGLISPPPPDTCAYNRSTLNTEPVESGKHTRAHKRRRSKFAHLRFERPGFRRQTRKSRADKQGRRCRPTEEGTLPRGLPRPAGLHLPAGSAAVEPLPALRSPTGSQGRERGGSCAEEPGRAAGVRAPDVLPVRRLASRSRRFLSFGAVKVTAGGDRASPRDAGGTAPARQVAPRAGVCAFQWRHGEAHPGSGQGCSRAGFRCRASARAVLWVHSSFWRNLIFPARQEVVPSP